MYSPREDGYISPSMKLQRLYNGVRLLPDRLGPCPSNVYRIDSSAMPMIARMQKRGLQVDLAHFAKMDVDLTQDMDRVTADIHKLTGYWINPGSGDQVADLLFKKLGLKQAKPKMTASGDRESVEDEVLTAIQHQHPVVGKCLEYKEYEKLHGTYVRPIPKLAMRTAFGIWRLYPNFRTTRVPSGRLACANPNLLAMPTRTERGRDVRKGFTTDQGWTYVSVDESQIEVRLTAHRSKDPNLCSVYRNQEDVYSDFATSAFRLPDKRYRDEHGKWKYPGIDKNEHRFPAKTCVLASIYDVTAGGLQEQMPVICANCNKPSVCTKCDQSKPHLVPSECNGHTCSSFKPLWIENKCQDIINAFYLRYPGILRARIEDHQYMRKHAYMVDMWGRLLHVQAARSVLEWVVAGALREGSNFPAQSGAQGTIKLAMAQIDDDLNYLKWYSSGIVYPLLQVHDELVFECREDMAEELQAICIDRISNCVRLEVPLEASGASAHNWGSLEK